MPDFATRARQLDAADPLAWSRKRFDLPDGVIYLDGNSLGPLPVGVRAAVDDVLRQWRSDLIGGWWDGGSQGTGPRGAGWWDAPLRVGERIGRLLGAAPGQTIAGDSTSVHLFNALVGAARLRPDRGVLLVDADGFPTDRYLAASVCRLLGLERREVATADLPRAIEQGGDQVAAVLANAVDFRTGELWDLPALTSLAHRAGTVVLWDLCHAAGALPLALDADEVDLAVGCGYKFLSGGPGAPGFLYVAARHQAELDQPLTGWHGHARPFDMSDTYEPAAGITRARIGTPPVLSLLALDAALGAFDGVDLAELRAKSLSLTDLFIACADELLAPLGVDVVTPRPHERRGSQVTLRHRRAEEVMAKLAERGVLGDVRPPNLLRFGVNALYLSHVDIVDAVAVLHDVA
jgi:kynureninase